MFNNRRAHRTKLRRELAIEKFEYRIVMAVAFMNGIDSLDVSNDGNITAIDALQTINEINVGGPRKLPDTKPDSSFFIDSSGDGFVSPIDALLVINYLNRRQPAALQRIVQDESLFAAEEYIRIGNGVATGLRTYSMRLDSTFPASGSSAAGTDTFAVYLVPDDNSAQTLIDAGINGNPIFTLSALGAETTPGITQFDGKVLSIDLAGVSLQAPVLKLQLLNHDTTVQSKVIVVPLSNTVNPDGQLGEIFESTRLIGQVGGTTATAGKTVAADVRALFSSMQFDRQSGLYEADIELENSGAALGRDTIAVFKNLPAGVTIGNASGQTGTGQPYINFSQAIRNGGIGTNERSLKLRVSVSNPNNVPFSLTPEILTGVANRPPVLGAISSISVMPGEVRTITIPASDPDGDALSYSILNAEVMPTTQIAGNQITFTPTKSQLGNYQFDVIVSDGAETVHQTVQLAVIADVLTTTRLSGKILEVDESPVAGMPVEVGAIRTTTDSTGSFLLDLGSVIAGDTIRIRADLLPGSNMPFIAEKIALLLGHDLYLNVNNQIARPIYLPRLNGGTAINPAVDQDVVQQLKANEAPASVRVAKGTLFNQNGSPFTGSLSITEVPANKTPAVLPTNVAVDTVVTIQPGEMTFATPAALTLPNRSNLPPGTLLDLYSINPTTGTFDKVGVSKVSADGLRIETISGGIRYSSWHFVAPPPPLNPENQTKKPEDSGKPPCLKPACSDVELYSGNYIEYHTVPSYTSLGEDRSLTLVYSSKRTNNDAIFRFNTDLPGWFDRSEGSQDHIGVAISLRHGETSFSVSSGGTGGGSSGTITINAKETDSSNRVGAGVQVDMTNMPDGIYRYSLGVGAYRSDGSRSIGSLVPLDGQVVKVSSIGSGYGSGWGIAGLQSLLVDSDESTVVVVDGAGTELTFKKQASGYKSPTGDLTTLSKNADGTFQRRLKDGSVYHFNSLRQLETITDRNGNVTRYEYDGGNRLIKLTDPVGLITILAYGAAGLSSIELPDGRKTLFALNSKGDLTQITDPDGSTRKFSYDEKHRLTEEITPLAAKETTIYDVSGRVSKVIRADGSTMQFQPAEVKAVHYPWLTLVLPQLPAATNTGVTRVATPSGNVEQYTLNKEGLITSMSDRFGVRSRIEFDQSLRPHIVTDSRGVATTTDFDAKGNPISQSTRVSTQADQFELEVPAPDGIRFEGRTEYFNVDSILDMKAADFNGDGYGDIAMITRTGTVYTLGVAYSSRGYFDTITEVQRLGGDSASLDVADIDGNDRPDIVLVKRFPFLQQEVWGYQNSGQGFQGRLLSTLPVGFNTHQFQAFDQNGDEAIDVFLLSAANANSVLLTQNADHSFTQSTVVLESALTSFVHADVNNDGREDIIAVSITGGANGLVSIYTQDSQHGYQRIQSIAAARASAAIAKSLDGDASVELLIGGDDLALYRFNGSTFDFVQRQTIGSTLRLALMESSNSGTAQIYVETASGSSTNLYSVGYAAGNLGAATRIAVLGGAVTSQAIDTNKDGVLDYVRLAGGIQVLTLTTAGEINQSRRLVASDTPTQTYSGDFNGDGVPDLAYSSVSGTVHALLGDGLGTFQDVSASFASTGRMSVGDLDGDGYSDVVASDAGRLTIAHSGTNGPFSRIATINTNLLASSIVLEDYNGDGVLDIIAAGGATNIGPRYEVYLSKANGYELATAGTVGGVGANKAVSGDFNGDGKLDALVWGAPFTGGTATTQILIGDGRGQLTGASVTIGAPAFIAVFRSLDINKDGFSDLIEADSTNRTLTVFQNNGDLTFTRKTLSGSIVQSWTPSDLVVFDINKDGVPDVLSADGNGFSVFLGQADGTFASRKAFSSTEGMGELAIVDLDLDGNSEVVSANRKAIEVNGGIKSKTEVVTTRASYNQDFSVPVEYVDALGRTTRWTLDPATGNVLKVSRPLGFTNSMTYLANGLMSTSTDALGRVTSYTYDTLGRLTRTTLVVGTPDEATYSFEYDPAGSVTRSVDANGNATTYAYDLKRRLIKTTDALGGITTYTRDAAGNVLTMTDAMGGVTRFTYDAMSHVTSKTDPIGSKTIYAYSLAGNLIQTTDPLAHVTRTVYDVANRATQSIDANGGTTKFTYDGNANLLSVTDPVGNTTRYFYDELNRQVREQDPLLQSSYFLYDATGNLMGKRDRNDRVTRYSYDSLDRLVEERWLGNDVNTVLNRIESTYDLNGNLLLIQDKFSTLVYSYDDRDRVKSATSGGISGQPLVTLAYSYDKDHLVATTDSINGNPGASTTFGYDELNRETTILQTGAGVSTKHVGFTYNAIGQTTGISRSSNADGTLPVAATTFSYDTAHRLTLINHKNATSGTTYRSFAYSYDTADRITRIVEDGNAIDYSYDSRDQLTAANYTSSNRTDETFGYDANGNRVTSNAHGSGYDTGIGNRLLSDGVYNYLYDKAGNLSKRTEIATGSIRELVWDHHDRLVSIAEKNIAGELQQVTKYTYDTRDRRISRSVDSTPADAVDAAIEHFVYDGSDVILDFVDSDGSGPVVSQQTTRYLRGPGIDNLLALELPSGTNWVLQDHLGSTRALVSTVGGLIQSIDYDSFGRPIVAGLPLTRYLYTGRELHTDSGLYFYRARYYDESTGRFTNEDPIGFAGGSWNTQIYVNNSPIANRDPLGLEGKGVGGTVAGGLGIFSGEIGYYWIYTECKSYKYAYVGLGLGLGFGGYASGQAMYAGGDPSGLGGWGLAGGGFIAGGAGIAGGGSYSPGSGSWTAGGGTAFGYGLGIAGLGTYTWLVEEKTNPSCLCGAQ